MIIVGYNPGGRYTRETHHVFQGDRLDGLYRAIEGRIGLSPSVSIRLFGATAEDFE